MPSSRRRARHVSVVVAIAVLLYGCSSSSSTASAPRLSGSRIEVLAVWSGAEQANFERVLKAFERATGATVTYTSSGRSVPSVLAGRIAQGRVPDVAFLPQPGLLEQYAEENRLVALDHVVGAVVGQNYSRVWRELASANGHLYGVWFKAADKSLVWYNVGVFERAGVVPPETIQGLPTVARAITATGVPAFSVSGADGWTLTDWFENLYLRLAGKSRYDLLARHRLAWTDASVRETLRFMSALLSPTLVAGGTQGAITTSYESSVRQVFAVPPGAAMVAEGDFVAGFITADTTAALGVDADVFPFPPNESSVSAMVGGGDVAVLMKPSAAGEALLRYLATPEAAAIWASRGGFLSPNLNLDLSVYPDQMTRSVARQVLDAGDDFRFDLSDLQPPAFGGSEDSGMRRILKDFMVDRDVDGTAARLEAAAATAFASR